MIIELQALEKQYTNKNNAIEVLKNLNLEVGEGEFISIMGKSGVGKTTLLNIIGLLDNEYTGKYKLNGIEISSFKEKQKAHLRNESYGFIMQEFGLIERYSVFENIIIPLEYSNDKRTSKKEKRVKVKEILKWLNLSHKIDAEVRDLSGGQKQRVALARALINSPTVLIADEPTGALDRETAIEMMELLKKLNQSQKITIIIVTHDEMVASYCNKHYELRDGHLF